MTTTTLKMAMTAMADKNSRPKEVARRLGITTATLYAYVNGDGSPKELGQKLLHKDKNNKSEELGKENIRR